MKEKWEHRSNKLSDISGFNSYDNDNNSQVGNSGKNQLAKVVKMNEYNNKLIPSEKEGGRYSLVGHHKPNNNETEDIELSKRYIKYLKRKSREEYKGWFYNRNKKAEHTSYHKIMSTVLDPISSSKHNIQTDNGIINPLLMPEKSEPKDISHETRTLSAEDLKLQQEIYDALKRCESYLKNELATNRNNKKAENDLRDFYKNPYLWVEHDLRIRILNGERKLEIDGMNMIEAEKARVRAKISGNIHTLERIIAAKENYIPLIQLDTTSIGVMLSDIENKQQAVVDNANKKEEQQKIDESESAEDAEKDNEERKIKENEQKIQEEKKIAEEEQKKKEDDERQKMLNEKIEEIYSIEREIKATKQNIESEEKEREILIKHLADRKAEEETKKIESEKAQAEKIKMKALDTTPIRERNEKTNIIGRPQVKTMEDIKVIKTTGIKSRENIDQAKEKIIANKIEDETAKPEKRKGWWTKLFKKELITFKEENKSEEVDEIAAEEIRKRIERADIEADMRKKPLFYYSAGKISNPEMLRRLENSNLGIIDLRKITEDSGGNYNLASRIFDSKEKDDSSAMIEYSEYNVFGITKILKNFKELIKEGGGKIDINSDKALFEIRGPDGLPIQDNVAGNEAADKIYKEATRVYREQVEEEYKRLNNK